MTQLQINFDAAVPNRLYDGSTIDHDKDHKRLRLQHAAVFNVMKDGHWRPLALIARLTGAPEASVSARLRDFRKERFGAHTVQRERRDWDGGTWVYRLVVRVAA